MKRFAYAGLILVCVVVVLVLPLRAIAGLESPCNSISDLVATNPLSSDLASTSDDHLRCIKLALRTTFPNINAAVTSSDEELNLVDGLSGTIWTSANDGSGSGLDADTIDTINSTDLARLSQANTFTASPIENQNAGPLILFDETDADADERSWLVRAIGGRLVVSTATDSAPTTAAANAIDINRTGTTVDLVNLLGTAVQTNGVPITAVSTSFTGTLTGCTTSPTGTIKYERHGNVVTLYIPSIQGTSNATTMTITGVPAAIQPATSQSFPVLNLVNNGGTSFAAGNGLTLSGGTITFLLGGSASGFAAANTKGTTSDGITITYILT